MLVTANSDNSVGASSQRQKFVFGSEVRSRGDELVPFAAKRTRAKFQLSLPPVATAKEVPISIRSLHLRHYFFHHQHARPSTRIADSDMRDMPIWIFPLVSSSNADNLELHELVNE